MTDVVANTFDAMQALAFYKAVTLATLPGSPSETATDLIYSFTDGTTDYTLDFFGKDLSYYKKIPVSGSLIAISETQTAHGSTDAPVQDFSMGTFSYQGSDNLPISLLTGWVVNKDIQGAFDTIFAGNDTFTIVGPGPNTIDGGPGTDTAQFGSAYADYLVNLNADGSVFVEGPEGSTVLKNIEVLQFSDISFTVGQLGVVSNDYALLEGRAPTGGEVGYWTGLLAGGLTDAQLQQDLANDPGNPRPYALVDSIYESNGGRAATGGELGFWVAGLQNGSVTVAQVAAYLNNPQISPGAAAAGADTVQAVYELVLGAPAGAADLSYWEARLQNGQGTIGDLEQALVHSPSYFGPSSIETGVTAAYENLIGRDPTADELSFWSTNISAGTGIGTLGFLRAGLQGSTDGQNHLAADVQGLYESIFGRDPSSDESSYWVGALQGGVGVDQLRGVLVENAPAGQIAHNVTQLYEEFLGREPSTAGGTFSELTDAVNRISNGVVEMAQLQKSLGAQADAGTLINDVVGLHQLYTGAAPDAATENAELSAIFAGTLTLQHLAQQLLHSDAGQAQIDTNIINIYGSVGDAQYADATTQAFWAGRLNSGESSYAQITDLLQSITTDPTYVTRLDFTGSPTEGLSAGASLGHVVIDGFTPGSNFINAGPGFAGVLPLAHAEQTTDLFNGHSDVLITLDANDSILLKGVTLDQLHAADFMFS